MACIGVYPGTSCQGRPDFLLDCGHGTPGRLAEAGLEAGSIGTFALSHNHMDHNSGVMPIVMGGLLAGRSSFRMIGPGGTLRWWQDACRCYPSLEKAEMNVHEVSPGDAVDLVGETGNSYSLEAAGAVHSATALALRIVPDEVNPVGAAGDPGGSSRAVVYSGDTEPCKGVADLCRPGDVLIHECSFPDSVARDQGGLTNHTCPGSLVRWLDEYGPGPGKIVLTHFYPHCEGHWDDMMDSLEQHSGLRKIRFTIAEDLMELQL